MYNKTRKKKISKIPRNAHHVKMITRYVKKEDFEAFEEVGCYGGCLFFYATKFPNSKKVKLIL